MIGNSDEALMEKQYNCNQLTKEINNNIKHKYLEH